ncbi:hypothetical protein HMPREF0658_1806 [Hoylesella marshii DSM 16973 = JCM 13450]|uniref:Uncharacterized protein n=1 Tax=Hoylesella marshii DSM 16973 = JCM 13450 TaxID=862515 RepID=E0NUF3_9BACT|nr:hypothetical protein HMPREF0658_1806 [Hoylesella marshii DSM 16973 = JCM 13450]
MQHHRISFAAPCFIDEKKMRKSLSYNSIQRCPKEHSFEPLKAILLGCQSYLSMSSKHSSYCIRRFGA